MHKAGEASPKQQTNQTSKSTKTPTAALEQARAGLSTIETLGGGVASDAKSVQSIANTVSSEASTWEPLLANVRIVAGVLEGIGEVRLPYSLNMPCDVHKPSLDSPICENGDKRAILCYQCQDTVSHLSSYIYSTLGLQVILKQEERDTTMAELLNAMEDTYQYVTEDKEALEPLSKDRKAVLETLSRQTIDCAHFIREGTKDKNFCWCYESLDCSFSDI